MARGRVNRRYGSGPYVVGLRRDPSRWQQGFPFDLPALAAIDEVRLDQPVTMLAGRTGPGSRRSLRRSLRRSASPRREVSSSASASCPPCPAPSSRAPSHQCSRPLSRATATTSAPRASSTSRASSTLMGGSRPTSPSTAACGCTAFLALAANRFGADGLYLLDEPEAALSVSGQLALLAVIVRAAGEGAQFVVATHSPILLACPSARLYELDEHGVSSPPYDELGAVRLTRGFLDAPERYLRAIEANDDTPA